MAAASPLVRGLRRLTERYAAWRFLAVSALCAGLHNIVLIGGDAASLHYALSSIVSYLVVVPTGYALHVRFTFCRAASWRSLVRYAVTMIGNLPLSVALLFVLCDLSGMPVALAGPVATVLVFGWNYLISHWSIAAGSTAPRAVG